MSRGIQRAYVILVRKILSHKCLGSHKPFSFLLPLTSDQTEHFFKKYHLASFLFYIQCDRPFTLFIGFKLSFYSGE